MMDNAGPRLMLHMDDLASTNVVQLGSRVSNRYHLLLMISATLMLLRSGFARGKNGEVVTTSEIFAMKVKKSGEALERAESFLLLSSLCRFARWSCNRIDGQALQRETL